MPGLPIPGLTILQARMTPDVYNRGPDRCKGSRLLSSVKVGYRERGEVGSRPPPLLRAMGGIRVDKTVYHRACSMHVADREGLHKGAG